jgi:inositol phosphorylceramide mannosyltransferase catalytic subunit
VSLSIGLITADPPRRLAAALEPLRPYADEIVIAADSRVDAETLAGYGSLADRLLRIDFRESERHLSWLYAQCSGDWILRLDGDEVPSQGFIRRLPEMLASRRVQQFWASVAWLYPDAERFLAGPPWSDFTIRLVRNDGTLRARGRQHLHLDPVTPCEYVEEPFYHLDLLACDEEERRDKAIRYEVSRPHLLAPGGGRINEAFYLPELRDSLELRAVPDEDRASIAAAFDAQKVLSSATTPTPDVPLVLLEEMDRLWEGRTVGGGAYRAKLEPHEPSSTLAPSEQRHVFFLVSNEGTERWPARLDADPPIRLSYRWLHTDGSVHTAEGPRSPFSRVVNPGERILTPLHVDAPPDAGAYLLEVDIVHEDVRWFGCSCRVPVRVEHPRGLPPAGIRLGETPPPRRQRWRRMGIPRTIHRVWLGGKPMPEEHERFGETFVRHHPDWEMRLWTDENLPELGITAAEREQARSQSELSNLVRYELLHRFGGVYVDTDVECQRSLTPLIRGIDAFAALEAPGRVGTAVLGSVASHSAFARAARLARQTLGIGVNSTDANGPYFLSLILEQEPRVAIFGADLFYPYSWDEPERRNEAFPDAYTVHHWALSWLATPNGSKAALSNRRVDDGHRAARELAYPPDH